MEVSCTEEVTNTKFGSVTEVFVNSPDPAIDALRAEAESTGYTLRVFTPGTMGTTDYVGNRINAHVEKGPDDKYYIQAITVG